MCYQILLGNATNQEHLQLCSFRTFDGINIWADANHWRLPRFKMSCCTWASFKTLVFVGMLTAKFWAYLNPQSEPQFYNRFLKKLSQCCFLESSRRNAWINQCTLRRDPPNLGNFISRVRRKNDPQYFYTLRRKSWCICTQALNKYYNKHSRLIKNATEPWLLLHSNEKCRTSCYCRHCIQFPLIRFSFGWTVWESLNDCVWIRGLASSK